MVSSFFFFFPRLGKYVRTSLMYYVLDCCCCQDAVINVLDKVWEWRCQYGIKMS